MRWKFSPLCSRWQRTQSLPVGNLHLELEMVAVFGGEILGHFLVAFQALVSRSAGAKLVAGGTLRGAVQRGMSLGKRTGRNLRPGNGGKRQKYAEEQKREKRGAFGDVAQRIDEQRDDRGIVHAFLRSAN